MRGGSTWGYFYIGSFGQKCSYHNYITVVAINEVWAEWTVVHTKYEPNSEFLFFEPVACCSWIVLRFSGLENPHQQYLQNEFRVFLFLKSNKSFDRKFKSSSTDATVTRLRISSTPCRSRRSNVLNVGLKLHKFWNRSYRVSNRFQFLVFLNMKLLTHNLLSSKCVKGVKVGYPLRIVVSELTTLTLIF